MTDAAAPSLDGFLAGVEVRAWRLAAIALGDRDEAMDAVQDAMERLLHYRQRPAEEWPALFWQILRRQLTDRHRRRVLQQRVLGWLQRAPADAPEQDPLDQLPAPDTEIGRQIDDERAMRRLSAALRDLPARQREAFLLRMLQGLDGAQTAAAMGCSEGSVKTHLSRAMQVVRARLEEWR